jgi:hypothetical protein
MPSQFLAPYLIANGAAVVILTLAIWKPRIGRACVVAVFVWAAITNARVAVQNPAAYVEYAALTPFAIYRDFIGGWFSTHVRWMVLPIAAGQLAIAILLMRQRPWRDLGVAGAVIFLAAIAPLGVGAGFPFSVTFGAAVIVASLKDRARLGTQPERRRQIHGEHAHGRHFHHG